MNHKPNLVITKEKKKDKEHKDNSENKLKTLNNQNPNTPDPTDHNTKVSKSAYARVSSYFPTLLIGTFGQTCLKNLSQV